MNRFEYQRPATVPQAIAAAGQAGAAYLAGGTNLLDLMKGNVIRPAHVIDITRLPGLNGITMAPDGSGCIGALVRNGDLAHHAEFAAATGGCGGSALRRLGAIAQRGNRRGRPDAAHTLRLFSGPRERLQQTRSRNRMRRGKVIRGCTPYSAGASSASRRTRPTFACRSRPLMPWWKLTARTARVKSPLEAFHLLPGATPQNETVLEPGELITAVRLPASAAGFAAHARYLKIRDRTSYAFAVVSAAAGLRLDGDTVIEARLALGGVALKPWRARAAEAWLAGRTANRDNFRQAAELALADARPSGENEFKIELARRLAARTLSLAAAGNSSRLPPLPGSVVNQIAEPQS